MFLEHDPVAADLALVFACADDAEGARRARHAARLFEQGFVPVLLLSGGGRPDRGESEARSMAREAAAASVPRDALLLEEASANTVENVQLSLDLLERHGRLDAIQTILLVSSPWHMRRVMATARASVSETISLRACPTTEGCTRSNWTSSPACRAVVRQEAFLLGAFQAAGLIPELES